MTANDPAAGSWKPIPGFSFYEASTGQPDGRGEIRSVDRTLPGGRRCKGQVLAARLSNSGYPQVNLRDDQGARQTRPVHSLMMLAHEGPCPPGKQVRHYNDISDDNRWAPGGEANCGPGKPGNLIYGTPKQNRDDRHRNSPPAPKPPPRLCACGQPVTKGSAKRCHDCVVQMGVDGAELLRAGLSREAAARQLEYPSPDGLVRLAVRYGGFESADLAPDLAAKGGTGTGDSAGLSRRVMVTVRRWLRRGRSA
jgi:NUMOD4 motif